jgi:hypothetical protein
MRELQLFRHFQNRDAMHCLAFLFTHRKYYGKVIHSRLGLFQRLGAIRLVFEHFHSFAFSAKSPVKSEPSLKF